jgi:hypothetical protein
MPRSLLLASVILIAGCAPAPATPAATSKPTETATLAPVATESRPEKPKEVAAAPLTPPLPPDACVPYFNPLTSEEAADGWISLFDGQSLFGWTSNKPEVNWTVKDGVITADSGPIGLLNTTVPFADYEFRCEYKMAAGGNSGVFLRTLADPKSVQTDCYELNIADEHPEGFLTGSIVGHKTAVEPIKGSGDWKKLAVKVEGNRIVVTLDGKEVLDYTDEKSVRKSGLIGLQKNKEKIEFRNIALRPLKTEELFNGQDTAGWHVVPGSKSEFTVKDGTIHCKNGQGFLETDRTFGNFVLQMDAQTHAADLNSGFFFRAMKGTEKDPSNGYEVQIHNGTEGGDPCRPANAGTGAIFRRISARRVIPKDNEWFTTTLVADGNRIAVWVNGYAVVDWEDTRPADPNPRKGQRLEPGHISLQGHDPTTDVSFRNIRASELP